MGMYDTVILPKPLKCSCGKSEETELQTKDLECLLTYYRFPDYVDSTHPGDRLTIELHSYCTECQQSIIWQGVIQDQVLCQLGALNAKPTYKERVTSDLRNTLQELRITKRMLADQVILAKTLALLVARGHSLSREELSKYVNHLPEWEQHTATLDSFRNKIGMSSGPSSWLEAYFPAGLDNLNA